MTEEYELSIYDRHKLNYDQIALRHLPISIIKDSAIHTIPTLTHLAKGVMEGHFNSRSITKKKIKFHLKNNNYIYSISSQNSFHQVSMYT